MPRGRAPNADETYSTTEALPVIFPAKSFHGLHTVPNDVLAPLAPRRAQPDVARLTIRVSLIHGEANVVILKFAIPLERDAAPGALRILAIDAGGQKRVPALGAEKVLFVVRALPKFWVIQCDETLVHNRRLAVITPWCKALGRRSHVSERYPGSWRKITHTSW